MHLAWTKAACGKEVSLDQKYSVDIKRQAAWGESGGGRRGGRQKGREEGGGRKSQLTLVQTANALDF